MIQFPPLVNRKLYDPVTPSFTVFDDIDIGDMTDLSESDMEKMIPEMIKEEILSDFELDDFKKPCTTREPTLNYIVNGDIATSCNSNLMQYLLCDCKWSGCDPDCAKSHISHAMCDESFIDHLLLSPKDVFSMESDRKEIPPYTPDSDHCYSAKKVESDSDEKLDVLQQQIPTPPSTSAESYSETSEDEVDVVTVPEEYKPPVVPKSALRRNTTKGRRGPKKAQQTLSAKSLKAAMKRSRITVARRTYKRKKPNSVETSPFSSAPSSDVEDNCNKRANHNTSERKRREIQRTNLQLLRACIPELVNNPKAPKVLILDSATTLVKKLQQNEDILKRKKIKMLQDKSNLTNRLNLLRMQLNM